MPEPKPSGGIQGSWGWGILAIPHLCRTRLVHRGLQLWAIRAWPSAASELLPAATVSVPRRHPIEESSKEQNIRVPCRRFRELEALACPCESGIEDRKSTRLNSSHVSISYAVF